MRLLSAVNNADTSLIEKLKEEMGTLFVKDQDEFVPMEQDAMDKLRALQGN
jgi:hypothetical protein